MEGYNRNTVKIGFHPRYTEPADTTTAGNVGRRSKIR